MHFIKTNFKLPATSDQHEGVLIKISGQLLNTSDLPEQCLHFFLILQVSREVS